ncbi:zinc-finger homeodomain protein 1-like [Chenopodium quinoa]|uniref:zinc-finger homeodomain protein 1-like n=1 Tax=Chenopodium quinoa TaxID=63459 RepID=UPI000B789E23|nr:zinc-finger homeodomain protein 1-like [Chenopodium quinoa]
MMEFEEEHEEEEEEEEESEMAITPTFKKQHQPTATVRYRECLKNHAIGIGGHAVDGCGEFLPAGAEGSIDAFRCAACSCHRNFHRKEYSNSIVPPQLAMYASRPHHHQQQQHPHQVYQIYPYSRNSGGYLHVSSGQRPLALPSPTSGGTHNHHHHQEETGGGGDQVMGSGGGNGNVTTRVGGGGTMDISGGSTMLSGGSNTSSGKKRFRTKFTPEQKDKMLGLAEQLGWRIQKQDEELVHQFCNQTGIKRHVLKVWMHNNKLTLGKKTLITTPPPLNLNPYYLCYLR